MSLVRFKLFATPVASAKCDHTAGTRRRALESPLAPIATPSPLNGVRGENRPRSHHHWSLLVTTLLFLPALITAPFSSLAAPLDTGFFYQGLLTEAGTGKPNPGKFNFEHYWVLYDSPTGGLRVAGPVTNVVEVTDGVFTTFIDFGANVFDGRQYWLEIGLRTNTTAAFTTLLPRQPVRPTPYALHALTSGGVAAAAINNAALAANAVSADKIAPRAVVKSLNGLTDGVELVAEGDLTIRQERNQLVLVPLVNCNTYSNCYWNLLGNGNLTEGTHFLGTVAGETAPLEFRVQNNRSFLHVFTGAATAPNLIGGYQGNRIFTGVGNTISGGGELAGINQILGGYGAVAGGRSNIIGSPGLGMPAHSGAIGGGHHNHIDFEVVSGTIGGGETNYIESYLRAPTIGGGSRNSIRASYGSIGGGQLNLISAIGGTISGGERNWIQIGAANAAIGGGVTNRIEADAAYATIGGGGTNRIGTNSAFAVVSGGGNNVVGTNSPETTIAGGQRNFIDANTGLATISGGGTNRIQPLAVGATIGGGAEQVVTTTAPFATIPGGARAMARSYGQLAYASGSFSSIGDAQAGVYVVRNTTSTNTGSGLITDLFLDGASRRIRVPADAAWTFEISIAARDAGVNSAAYLARGTIENNGGATALPVAAVIDTLHEDVAAWDVQVLAEIGRASCRERV